MNADARRTLERLVRFGHHHTVYEVVFSADGTLIVTGSGDNTVRVWDRKTLSTISVLTGHADRVWSVDISPDGRRIASASSDGTVKIWSVSTGRELVSLRGPTAWRHVRFSPDGEKLAAGSAGALVALWAAPYASLARPERSLP
ncbi:MAG: hypothetical protein IT182_16010 [Acidobacteria bacterium]|nr:hypothetical protein [Acidobacteriota bacterium]